MNVPTNRHRWLKCIHMLVRCNVSEYLIFYSHFKFLKIVLTQYFVPRASVRLCACVCVSVYERKRVREVLRMRDSSFPFELFLHRIWAWYDQTIQYLHSLDKSIQYTVHIHAFRFQIQISVAVLHSHFDLNIT